MKKQRKDKLKKRHQLYVWTIVNLDGAWHDEYNSITAVARDLTHLMEVIYAPFLGNGETIYNLTDAKIMDHLEYAYNSEFPVPNNWMELWNRVYDRPPANWHARKVGIALPGIKPSVIVMD